MFTGIVEELGRVARIERRESDATLWIQAQRCVDGLRHGDSLAVNGVCLTMTGREDNGLIRLDVMGPTLQATTTGRLREDDRVNLERATPVGGRLGGHMVLGHVDACATILSRITHENWTSMRFSIPPGLETLIAHRGSVTVDGVSLTVSDISEPAASPGWFEVGLIPTTLDETTMGARQPGDQVNIEIDVMARYAERLHSVRAAQHQTQAEIKVGAVLEGQR